MNENQEIDITDWSIKKLKAELVITENAIEIVAKELTDIQLLKEPNLNELNSLRTAMANLANDKAELITTIRRRYIVIVVRIICLILLSWFVYKIFT